MSPQWAEAAQVRGVGRASYAGRGLLHAGRWTGQCVWVKTVAKRGRRTIGQAVRTLWMRGCDWEGVSGEAAMVCLLFEFFSKVSCLQFVS